MVLTFEIISEANHEFSTWKNLCHRVQNFQRIVPHFLPTDKTRVFVVTEIISYERLCDSLQLALDLCARWGMDTLLGKCVCVCVCVSMSTDSGVDEL